MNDRTLTSSPLSDEYQAELAAEQRHVDRVYHELGAAYALAEMVEKEGLSRVDSDRSGEVREEEISALYERDVLVHAASVRKRALDQQYEGLVFGRLDMELGDAPELEARYVGRLGVRDADYEPLVIDWRAPAAAPFYQATPVDRYGVVRRRVLRCRGEKVVGAEDDLMVPEPPDGMVVLGDGALMAALTRSRTGGMRDIVATIQAHQDQAIRASSRGVTEITGGPGTGKTVVALHRAAYLLYSERRRYESGGVFVVGPSSAYTAYIERVLPSLGEDSVTLRSLGDIVDAVTATRWDTPSLATIKGSLRMRTVLARAAAAPIPGVPELLRVFVKGTAIRLEASHMAGVRRQVLARHRRNHPAALNLATELLAAEAWKQCAQGERSEFIATFIDHLDVEAFVRRWWRPVDPREVLLWLADDDQARSCADGVLKHREIAELAADYRETSLRGTWSIADVALIDELASVLGETYEMAPAERGFYEIEEYDDPSARGVREVGQTSQTSARSSVSRLNRADPMDLLLHGHIGEPATFAHILVDEAQDVSPMQWRMIGRRADYTSWTVVGDAAQASWPFPEEATRAREAAYGQQPRQAFHMDTNYRNAREIFAYAERMIRQHVPDADIPAAVRETGVEPLDLRCPVSEVTATVAQAVRDLLGEVEGSVAVVSPERHWTAAEAAVAEVGRDVDRHTAARVQVVDPLSTKGLEYDATVVVDPDSIVAESPGGARVLYVVLTRAAHRMTVVSTA